MTLTQLHYLITIAETKSLNKAAELLYVSQPSLTNAMKELEKEHPGCPVLVHSDMRVVDENLSVMDGSYFHYQKISPERNRLSWWRMILLPARRYSWIKRKYCPSSPCMDLPIHILPFLQGR